MGPSGTRSSFRKGERQSTPSPRRPLKALHAKSLGPMPPLPSVLNLACHYAHRTAFCSFLRASCGLTLTLGRPPRGPSQVAWRHNAGEWGHPIPSARLTLPPGNHRGLRGRHCSFSVGEGAGTSEQPSTFKCHCTKTFGPTLSLSSALTSVCHTASHTAFGSRLKASWGLTLTLGRPQSGPSQGTWSQNAGDWGPPSPSARLTVSPGHHMCPSGPRGSFSMGERAEASEAPATFEGDPR